MRINMREVTLECVIGDIAAQPDVEAVVNAANAQLMPGGGVAGALHRAAGPELAAACAPLAPLEPGEAVLTEAYRLPNRYVIHCLGPVFGRDEPAADLLARCYTNALQIAEANQIESIAFPAISTGAFGYPLNEGAEVACRSVVALAGDLRCVKLVRFVLHQQPAYRAFSAALVHAAASHTPGEHAAIRH